MNGFPDREQLLWRIQALSFTAVDLNLYLDTHPWDTRALADYNQISAALAQTRALYEQLYGPMLNFGMSCGGDSWRWVEEPWPWQISTRRLSGMWIYDKKLQFPVRSADRTLGSPRAS